MKKIIKKFKLLPWLVPLGVFGIFNSVLGQFAPGDYPEPDVPGGLQEAQDVIDLIDRIINYILIALIILSAAFIAFAGFTYVTSAGDEGKIKKAKDWLTYGAIGLVFVVGAKGIIWIIFNLIS